MSLITVWMCVVWPRVHTLKDCNYQMRNLDSCRRWRCTLCPCKVRHKCFIRFWYRTILLCMPCTCHCLKANVTALKPMSLSPPSLDGNNTFYTVEMTLPTLILRWSFLFFMFAKKSCKRLLLVLPRQTVCVCKQQSENRLTYFYATPY
jgi:hypothetical protein